MARKSGFGFRAAMRRHSRQATLGMSLEQKIEFYTERHGPDDCWPWTSSHNYRGYPELTWRGVTRSPQRLLSRCPPHLQIRHTCDNPTCMNPSHWLHGTAKDNADDRHARNRHWAHKGENHGLAKLTEAQVLEARRMRQSEKCAYQKIADQFGVSERTIRRIVSRETWRHV